MIKNSDMFRILCDPSSVSVERAWLKLLVIFLCALPNTDYTHKNITSNFSQARSTLTEDGSQRIQNMSEFLVIF